MRFPSGRSEIDPALDQQIRDVRVSPVHRAAVRGWCRLEKSSLECRLTDKLSRAAPRRRLEFFVGPLLDEHGNALRKIQAISTMHRTER